MMCGPVDYGYDSENYCKTCEYCLNSLTPDLDSDHNDIYQCNYENKLSIFKYSCNFPSCKHPKERSAIEQMKLRYEQLLQKINKNDDDWRLLYQMEEFIHDKN